MAATIIDSRIFGNIFGTDAMRRVWSDENRTAQYIAIEKALAIVQGRLGIIPADAATEIARNCDIAKFDLEKLRAQTERIGYPILGVVSQLNALCRDGLGEYCHWGATTQDVTDTATVLQIRESLALVDADLAALAATLAGLARKYRDTPVVGRSNLQQAIPVTFGYKIATILAAVAAAPRAARAALAARARRGVRRRLRHARVARGRARWRRRRPSWPSSASGSPRSRGTRSATTSPRSAASWAWSAARSARSRWT